MGIKLWSVINEGNPNCEHVVTETEISKEDGFAYHDIKCDLCGRKVYRTLDELYLPNGWSTFERLGDPDR